MPFRAHLWNWVQLSLSYFRKSGSLISSNYNYVLRLIILKSQEEQGLHILKGPAEIAEFTLNLSFVVRLVPRLQLIILISTAWIQKGIQLIPRAQGNAGCLFSQAAPLPPALHCKLCWEPVEISKELDEVGVSHWKETWFRGSTRSPQALGQHVQYDQEVNLTHALGVLPSVSHQQQCCLQCMDWWGQDPPCATCEKTLPPEASLFSICVHRNDMPWSGRDFIYHHLPFAFLSPPQHWHHLLASLEGKRCVHRSVILFLTVRTPHQRDRDEASNQRGN